MASPILGPITKVPYDVLTEIFIHCLPERRLQHRQPNTTIAPILLCHICSTWRTVAMAAATLWSHLSCRLKARGRFLYSNWIVRKKEYAFLLWWKNNQRSMAPSLCLDLRWNSLRNSETVISERILDSELELDRLGMISLFDHISSAKYLETKGLFWSIVGLRIKRGDPIVYPVPQTLVVTNWIACDSFFQDQIALVPTHSPSALRHLYLNGESNIRVRGGKIPTHWSSLTHLAFLVYEMSLDYWYSLIRSVPQLQSGCFQLKVLGKADETEPPPFTLAQLSTLSISVGVAQAHAEFEFALALPLAALHLPALRDLSLFSEEEWYDHRAIDHIYAVLDAVPTIRTLTLGPSFLTLQKDEQYLWRTLPRIKDAEPIWRRTPRLAHLRLVAESPFPGLKGYAEECRAAFVRNLFHPDSRWLDFNNPACPIRSVTIIDRQRPERPASNIADYTWSRIREHAGRSPDVRVVFDVVFETQKQAIAGAWNEWGPNLQ